MGINQREIKALLQKENPLILEIGAHVGSDTRRFLNEFKDVKIYCFEPDPRCIENFKKNINDRRCTLVEAAVSNGDGEILLNMSGGWPINKIPYLFKRVRLARVYVFVALIYRRIFKMKSENNWDASSSIKHARSHPKDYPWLTFYEKVIVKMIKLDTWAIQNGVKHIDFIWTDVQGAERDLIEGATNTLKSTKYFYVEYGEIASYEGALTRAETIELLSKHDFHLVGKHSENTRIGNLLFENKKVYNAH